MSWFDLVKARPSNIDRLDKLFERWNKGELSDEEYTKEYLELSEKLKSSERTTSMSNRALRYGGKSPIDLASLEDRPKRFQHETRFSRDRKN